MLVSEPDTIDLMKISTFTAFIAAALIGSQSYGAVILQDSYSAGSAGGAPTDLGGGIFGYEINLNPMTEFSAAGHGKLVMTYSSHDGTLGGATPSVTQVTYNGVQLTQAAYAIDNGLLVSAGIFYLDNVASDGTLRIELSASNLVNFGFGLYALDGLKPGVQDTGSGRLATELTTTLPVTISTSEGFFVQEAARNNQTFADSVDDFQTLYNYSANSYRALSQYQVTSAPGDYVAPIGNTGENYRIVVAAGFEAAPELTLIPEPTSISLLGLGALGLVLRRRR